MPPSGSGGLVPHPGLAFPFRQRYVHTGGERHGAAEALAQGIAEGYAAAVRDVKGAERLQQFAEFQGRAGNEGGRSRRRRHRFDGAGSDGDESEYDSDEFDRALDELDVQVRKLCRITEELDDGEETQSRASSTSTVMTRMSRQTGVGEGAMVKYSAHRAEGTSQSTSHRSHGSKHTKKTEDHEKRYRDGRAHRHASKTETTSHRSSAYTESTVRPESSISQASHATHKSDHGHTHRSHHHRDDEDLRRQVLAVDPGWLPRQQVQSGQLVRQDPSRHTNRPDAQAWYPQRQEEPRQWPSQSVHGPGPAFAMRDARDAQGQAVFPNFDQGGRSAANEYIGRSQDSWKNGPEEGFGRHERGGPGRSYAYGRSQFGVGGSSVHGRAQSGAGGSSVHGRGQSVAGGSHVHGRSQSGAGIQREGSRREPRREERGSRYL